MKKGFLMMIMALAACANQPKKPVKVYYSQRAWEQELQGTVHILYDINNEGRVRNVRVTESLLPYSVTNSVKEQIYKWRFEKGFLRKDVAVTVQLGKPSLEQDKSPHKEM